MSDRINFGTMTDMVAARLGNMDATSDPLFEAYLGAWVNEAGNAVVLRALDKSRYKYGIFPELEDKWIVDSTTNDVSYVARPDDLIILTGMYSFDLASGATENSPRHLMTKIENDRKYEMMSKTQEGWPRQYRRYGNRVYIYPLPATGYLSQTLMLGLAKENTLSADGDTFVTEGIWHPAVVDYATFVGASWLGWFEEASAAVAMCDQKLENSISIRAYELQSQNSARKIKGDPTRKL